MKQEKNEVLLTVKELNKLGAELNEIIYQLDMVNVAIQGLEFTERKDNLTFQWIARQFFTTNYTLNENISKKLDEIACYLLNADNDKEVLLTVKDLNKLGAELNEIIYQLDMVNVAIQGLEFTERKDDLTFQWIARQFFTTNYTLNENISRKLDEVACYLLNADDKHELEVLKND